MNRSEKAKLKRQTDANRRAFRFEFARCMVPGCTERRMDWLACHEVLNGVDRHHAVKHRELWLILCGPHHQQSHKENWTPAKELALRALWFPEDMHWSRELYLKLKGWADTAITVAEIEAELKGFKADSVFAAQVFAAKFGGKQ